MEQTRSRISPVSLIYHDAEKYLFEIELPGVEKEEIELEAVKNGFCLKAGKEEIKYASCYSLAHEIDFERIRAKFEDERLIIELPFLYPINPKRIEIE